jgi:probable F420-dependent oxidoreductase
VVLSGIGVWDAQLRFGDPAVQLDRASELEELGYSALWIPDVGGDVFDALRGLLGATQKIAVATGVLNLWAHPAAETAAEFSAIDDDSPNRLLVGIGVSHGPLVKQLNLGEYRRPLEAVGEFLDSLDTAPRPVPVHRRLLAALRPRMLEVARDRTAGSVPYHVPPPHTLRARQILGADAMLAPEQCVILDTDPVSARAVAREHLAQYIGLPNYVNNWFWLGFTEDDLVGGGSDRLVDAIVAWGDEEAIARRIREHFDAGANHVCVQALPTPSREPQEALRALAPALTS